ncbi:MAG TPA: NAD(P)/FAD-dependent oxidoreductase [Dehalococcoidia bacterium]|nr:NAD(P)/FAD-dependent oxidoreductase [Dehalococcoidia bacterium]
MTEIYEVIIIGAGPIGSYLAHRLAVSGRHVLVLDKNNNPGDKVCCTGIISKGCFDKLELDETIKYSAYNTAKLIGPLQQSLDFKRHNTVAYIVDRPALNILLSARARAAGVRVTYSSDVIDLQTYKDKISVKTRTGDEIKYFDGQMLVIATGFSPRSRLSPCSAQIPRFTIGMQSSVEVLNCSEPQIYLDYDIAPGGFAWLMPTWDNKGLAGVLCGIKPKQHLTYFLEKLKREGKISDNTGKAECGLIPLRRLKTTYGERLIVLGEAAGQVKPTTGGGIYYGLLCAEIAAEVIEKGFRNSDFSTGQFKEYQKQWHKLLQTELTAGYLIQSVWRRLQNKQLNYMFNLLRKYDFAGEIEKSDVFPFDWHSKVLLHQATRFIMSMNKK